MVLHASPSIEALMLNPGNKFHALSGDRKGQYAISINKQWRVCFEWQDGNAYHVVITPTTQLSDNDTICCVFNPNRSTMYCALNIKLRCRVTDYH